MVVDHIWLAQPGDRGGILADRFNPKNRELNKTKYF